MMGGQSITGRMVLIWLLAFFGTIFAVNAVLVFFALSSWPGLTTDKAYEEGIAYNRTLDAAAAQARLGWSSAVVFSATNLAGAKPRTGQFLLRLTDINKIPVTGLEARVRFRRPVREGFDVTVALKEIALGQYGAPVELPLAGRWYADIDTRRKGDTVYRMRHELMVTP
jgi:nitrogen fixation protein FixH